MSTEGIDATEAAVVASMLASDNVPDENQSANCLSCGAAMKGLHCVECGQKNDNYRRSIFSLIADLFGSVLSVESRIWRSWGALLFKPGKVAREFADGRRTHWSSPIRVYLAISILLFGFMTWTGTHLISLDVNAVVKDGVDKPVAELTSADITAAWDLKFFERQRDIDTRNESRDFSLLEIWLAGNMEDVREEAIEALGDVAEDIRDEAQDIAEDVADAVNIDAQTKDADEPPEFIQNLPQIGVQSETDEDGNFSITYNGSQVGQERAQEILVNFIKSPAAFTNSFNKWLPRLMFIMMPFTMLFGALFIRDKEKGLLFDHLVHAAYIHAVAFFLLFAGILLAKVISPAFVFQAIFIGLLFYLPLSLKRMFGRGWFKTIFTTYTVGLIYLIVMMLALGGLMTWDLSKVVSV